MSKKLLREIQNLSSDQNTEKIDSSHVFNENVSVKDTVVTVKDKPIPNGDTVNASEQSVNPQTETVAPDLDTVNGDEQSIHANAETVNPENDNVNPDEDMFNGNHVRIIVPVKTEKIEPEDVKPNLEESVLHVNSAVTEQSAELFSDCTIKKEESQDDPGINDSPISVKGRLSDEVTGNSFQELVNAADN